MAIKYNFFALFPDRYVLPLTMIVGATVGGMTSEGGGAVAFPVMTLALGIPPAIARDFSLMIQSCGKTALGFLNDYKKVGSKKWFGLLQLTCNNFFPNSSQLSLHLPDGAAGFIILPQFFLLPYTEVPGFKPMSVELHLTGTFEGRSTDLAALPRQTSNKWLWWFSEKNTLRSILKALQSSVFQT